MKPMRLLAKIAFGIRALFSRQKMDEQLSEEIRTHVEMATEANMAAGMTPDEARYAALREFGNVVQIQERSQDQRGWIWIEQLGQDLRYAVRQLARTPGFTVVVIMTLALGIGGTTAIYSMVDAVILNPVGGPEPDRMVQIGQRSMVQGKDTFQGVTPPVLEALLAHRGEFESIAWSHTTTLERQAGDFTNMEGGSYVSWNFFNTLQCAPLLGRGFYPDETLLVEQGVPDRDTVIVLSHAWWQSQWGGDPRILGRSIPMGGRNFTVVGVMPPHFRFPDRRSLYWIPIERMVIRPKSYAGPNQKVYARLKAGTTAAQAQALLDTLAARLMEAHPITDGYGASWRINQPSLRISFRPLSVAMQDSGDWVQLRQTLLGLLVAVCFVLLIACANVANLALARLERRQHELAVRSAMGAGRARLMRQLLTENLLLALLGGLAGLGVTAWALKVLVAMNHMPRLRPVEIDGQLLGVALALSAAAALFFGLAPIWQGGKVRVQVLLADGGLNSTSGRTGGHFRGLLVMGQVAVTVVLLAGAGLMLLSVARVLRVDPGFDPENLLLVDLDLPWRKYDLPDRAASEKLKLAIVEQLRDRFRALPGVQDVGVQQRSYSQAFERTGRPTSFVGQHALADTGAGNMFRAMRVPLLAGRHFTAEDAARPEIVIVNESFARQFWPGETAVGKTIASGDRDAPIFQVVGVVGDAKLYGYLFDVLPNLYHPFGAEWTKLRLVAAAGLQFVIRTEGDPEKLIPFIRHQLKEAEPALRTPNFQVAKQVLYESTLAQRTYRNYLGMFALLGLALSSLGVYGVLAFSVSRRTREIGIRMAIGADAREVHGMILRQGGRLILIGITMGLLSAAGLMRFLQSQLYQVDPLDPIVLLSATLLLGAVGLAACWLPARRAANVDPVVALRAE